MHAVATPPSLSSSPPRQRTLKATMSLVSLVIALIVVGVLLWALNTYLPLDPKIKTLINIVVVVCVVAWLLSVFGLFASLGTVTVPRVHR